MLSYLFFNNKNKQNLQILEPLLTLIKISLLYFKMNNTKISIFNNKIIYQYPNILQGTIRWTYGDTRDDLSHLFNPIIKSSIWFNPNTNIHIKNIYIFALKGLYSLKNTYSNEYSKSNLICHTISHFINILSNSLNININNIHNINNINLSNNIFNNTSQFISNNTSNNTSNNSSNIIYNNSYNNLINISLNNSTTIPINIPKNKYVDNENINNKLKNLWDIDEIKIISDLISVANKFKDSNKSFDYLINSIENILYGKEIIINDIYFKYMSSL
jgi:hypothetical protein